MVNLSHIESVEDQTDHLRVTMASGTVHKIEPVSFKMAVVHSEAKYFKMGEEEEAPKEVEGELI
ncbi:MAG: hypothetical protein ACRC6V_08625 [Bacteroidales bacterium]